MPSAVPATDLIANVKRDGYVVIRDVFDDAYMRAVHAELSELLDLDLKARAEENITVYARYDELGYSSLTSGSHMLLGLFLRSPRYARMMNDLFSDADIMRLLRAVAGGGFQLRGDNVRRSTGNVERGHPHNLPHEWHRDNPGEFGISVLITDILDRDNAATAFLPGSHLYPYDPRRNVVLGQPAFIAEAQMGGPISFCNSALARRAMFGRALARRLVPKSEQVLGRKGDVYVFLNDTWHGRSANRSGVQTMVSFCGAISARYPFPGNLAPPKGSETLSEPLRGMLMTRQMPDPAEQCILQWAEAQRIQARPPGLFWLAQQEHRLISWASRKLAESNPKYAAYERQAGPIQP
jgi:ectoine hydroxylase-related dioxygenase (phytanoyl-CoA dioxygenase family)